MDPKKGYYGVLKSNGVYPLGFGLAWICVPYYPQLFSFGIGMPILCLSHHCILEASSLSGFTDSQLERNFAEAIKLK